MLDLTKGRGQAFVKDSLKSGQVACVPMAPPCGTSSRARERKLSRRLRALGVPEPKPLRSAQFPMGFPWLQGKDKLRASWTRKPMLSICSRNFSTVLWTANSMFHWEPQGFQDVGCSLHQKTFRFAGSAVHMVPLMHARWRSWQSHGHSPFYPRALQFECLLWSTTYP